MSPTDRLNILACQIDVPKMRSATGRDRHLDNICNKVRQALSEAHADLVVLPELSSIDYSRVAFERLDKLAEPLNGPSYAKWRQVAREFGTHVAYSFARRAEDGYRIALAAVGPNGDLLGHYDKIHLAQYGASIEKEYFRRGAELFVFEVGGFRLAPIICYDIRIPELSRVLAIDHGVDLIIHAGAYFRDASFYSWHDFACSRAIENQIYLLSLNRAGADYGRSIFCPPWADDTREPVAFADRDEQFLRLVANRDEIDFARQHYSFLADRLENYRLPLNNPRVAEGQQK